MAFYSNRPSYLDYGSRPQARTFWQGFTIFLLIGAVLIGFFLYMYKFKASAEIDVIDLSSPAPSVFDPNTCPADKFLECRYGTVETKPECSREYVKWAKHNCPGFVGASF